LLDGYEHTATTTASFKFYEIAKFYALTQHLIDPTVVAFSLNVVSKRATGDNLRRELDQLAVHAQNVAGAPHRQIPSPTRQPWSRGWPS
jgi:TRAP-type C4-dicarboxylate transport system substrate-binding protein